MKSKEGKKTEEEEEVNIGEEGERGKIKHPQVQERAPRLRLCDSHT
jgi:hypothetical protein